MANNPSRIAELAASISKNTTNVENYLNDNGLPQPSFAADVPLSSKDLPPKIAAARMALLDDTVELRDLMQGPQQLVFWNVHMNAGLPADVLYRYRISHLVPLNDPNGISYTELSKQTGVALSVLTRVLRAAIVNRIFVEPSPGYVAHNFASRLLATDSLQESFLGCAVQDCVPAISHLGRALDEFADVDEPSQTGFSLYEKSRSGEKDLKTFYQIMQSQPARAKRFAEAMSSFHTGEGFAVRHVVEMFEWGQLEKGSTVVDIGGSHGDIAVAIGEEFEGLKFVVEDLKDTVESRPEGLELEREGRLEFLVHDYFEPQPVVGAEVYMLRWILHNNTDKYAVKILKALIPALKTGSRILIMDAVVPDLGTVSNSLERDIRMMDCAMFALFNSGDRDLGQWREIIERVDPRLKYKGIRQRDESRLSIIETVWEG